MSGALPHGIGPLITFRYISMERRIVASPWLQCTETTRFYIYFKLMPANALGATWLTPRAAIDRSRFYSRASVKCPLNQA
jgi:hypothetical protein